MPGTHWMTSHDPTQGNIEIITIYEPLAVHPQNSRISEVFAVNSVPVGSDVLSEGLMQYVNYATLQTQLYLNRFQDGPQWARFHQPTRKSFIHFRKKLTRFSFTARKPWT